MLRTTTLFAILATVSAVLGQATCGLDKKCPEDAPCCSQYGQCGVGAFCLGGCDPRSSFSLKSCTPEPVCVSKTYKFDSLDRITPNTQYLGDSSKTDWVSSGQPVAYQNNVLLTMPEGSVGTLLASSTYMWYGSVEATFKTSRGAGVVTAFILLSDVKDEIDYEFVGADLESAQSNYYFQGIPNYDNELNISLSDTFANYHTYKIDWTPDAITWSIDGQPGRTKKRSETWNATANQWDYPQTPARVQLSLWPAGSSTNGEGTIAWAGGLIDWQNSPDVKNNGYYYAMFESVTVNCYDATSSIGTNSGKSYTYNSPLGTNNTVVDGNDNTVLGSFLATGTNMTLGEVTASASGSATPSATVQTVPGLVNGGAGTNVHNGDSDSSSSAAASSATSPAAGSGSGSGSGAGSQGSSGSTGGYSGSGFSQGSTTTTGGKSGAERLNSDRILGSSVFAVIVAVSAMLVL